MAGGPSGDGPARTPWALYLGLAAVVWGLFVPDQGLWQDDVQNLFRAFVAPERGEGLFPAIATPTRRLLGLPFMAALATGWPVQALHLVSALSWLASGLLADRLARRLWPGAGVAPWLAGALTLCAASDFFTDAPLAVGYQLSIVAYLGAALLGLRWLQGGSRLALGAVPFCLAASVFTSDAAVAAWLATPAWWAAAPGRSRRRARSLWAVWFLAPLPYVVVLLRQLAAGGGYLQHALVTLTASEWLQRWGALLLWNFTPWRWAFDRPLWFPAAAPLVPLLPRLGLALAAGAAAGWILFRPQRAGEPSDAQGAGLAGVAASLVLMAVTNAAFVSVHLADLYCRTHLLSRVFASLALARLLWAVWARARRAPRRALVRVAAGAWLALGAAGALERQDYFAGHARAHRQELGSLLNAVPALAPDAHLLLRVPPHEAYLATEAGYLARAWATLLYGESSVECRVFLWSANRSTTCVPAAEGFRCRGELSPDCRRDGRETQLLPYERLVLLEYQPARNAYALAHELPPEALAGAARYRPLQQVRDGPRTRLAHALLERHGGLAAWLWP